MPTAMAAFKCAMVAFKVTFNVVVASEFAADKPTRLTFIVLKHSQSKIHCPERIHLHFQPNRAHATDCYQCTVSEVAIVLFSPKV